MKNVTITVEGMTCGHCEARVEKAVKALPGVQSAKADRTTNSLTVEGGPDLTSVEDLVAAVNAAGYKAHA